MQHRLHRDAEIGRSLGGALGQFAGADDGLVKRFRSRRLLRPFHDRLQQTLIAADDAEIAIPLRTRIEVGLAECQRLARHDQHRRFHDARGADRHRALQQARAGVQHHRLHPAGDGGVGVGHGDGDGLMAAVQVGGTGRSVALLPRHRLPERRPFGAGRADDVVDAQIAKRLEDGFAAVMIVRHGSPPVSGSLLQC